MPAGRPTKEYPICQNCKHEVYTHVPHYCGGDPEMDKKVQEAADNILEQSNGCTN